MARGKGIPSRLASAPVSFGSGFLRALRFLSSSLPASQHGKTICRRVLLCVASVDVVVCVEERSSRPPLVSPLTVCSAVPSSSRRSLHMLLPPFASFFCLLATFCQFCVFFCAIPFLLAAAATFSTFSAWQNRIIITNGITTSLFSTPSVRPSSCCSSHRDTRTVTHGTGTVDADGMSLLLMHTHDSWYTGLRSVPLVS